MSIADEELLKRCTDFMGTMPFNNPSLRVIDDLVKFVNDEIGLAYLSAAVVFELYASDQIASKRMRSTRRAMAECQARAGTWADAARELREAVK